MNSVLSIRTHLEVILSFQDQLSNELHSFVFLNCHNVTEVFASQCLESSYNPDMTANNDVHADLISHHQL